MSSNKRLTDLLSCLSSVLTTTLLLLQVIIITQQQRQLQHLCNEASQGIQLGQDIDVRDCCCF